MRIKLLGNVITKPYSGSVYTCPAIRFIGESNRFVVVGKAYWDLKDWEKPIAEYPWDKIQGFYGEYSHIFDLETKKDADFINNLTD